MSNDPSRLPSRPATTVVRPGHPPAEQPSVHVNATYIAPTLAEEVERLEALNPAYGRALVDGWNRQQQSRLDFQQQEMNHRHRMAEREAERQAAIIAGEKNTERLKVICGGIVGLVAVAGGVGLVAFDHDTAGSVIAGTGAIGILKEFLRHWWRERPTDPARGPSTHS